MTSMWRTGQLCLRSQHLYRALTAFTSASIRPPYGISPLRGRTRPYGEHLSSSPGLQAQEAFRVAMLFGARMPCGVRMSCGAATPSGGAMPYGEVMLSGEATPYGEVILQPANNRTYSGSASNDEFNSAIGL